MRPPSLFVLTCLIDTADAAVALRCTARASMVKGGLFAAAADVPLLLLPPFPLLVARQYPVARARTQDQQLVRR